MKRWEEYAKCDYRCSTDLFTSTFQDFQAYVFNKTLQEAEPKKEKKRKKQMSIYSHSISTKFPVLSYKS